MFTGIIEDRAIVKAVIKNAKGVKLAIASHKVSQETKIGDSISVNGACLTVVNIDKDILQFDIMPETLRIAMLPDLVAGDIVNVERSLRVGDRISGHFVTGHIDCTGTIISVGKGRNEYTIEIEVPSEKALYLAGKGSVAVDGISLTITESRQNRFKVSLIPLTLSVTSLSLKKASDKVNIEFDILAKYVLNDTGRVTDRIDADFLRKHGFV
ncbi:MAG: riboflavin synthase [Candidatus Omnitrophota bacterium]|nr:riboflavin synthase [Candidatus Omnitrophota bacterium]